MRSASTFAVLLAFAMLATPALAFDVQNGGGTSGSSANLAPDAAAPGVSLDMDLRQQLGLGEDKTAGMGSKSGLQFGGGVFSGSGSAVNTTTMGYDERPWVAPRRPAGRD